MVTSEAAVIRLESGRGENMAYMTGRISRLSQVLAAIIVIAFIIFIDVVLYGPDINGRIPSLADTMQGVAIESFIILAFVLSAIALFRWHRLGWWSSIVLDGLLSLAAIPPIVGDFNDRYMATQAGRDAFRGDLAIHGGVLFLCTGVTVLLLLARKQFITGKTI